ncbi:D-alanyl-D-alanine carboxypeptidase [Chthonobacter rhizosphaerae]|uniref:D-alanyl-D-alanine carboxypeptidase n=1 Tax=Chthonobacter rhizosphaerae TaxID=2735553 RepID=UPI0031B5A0CA
MFASVLAAGLLAAAPKISEANPKYAAIVVDTATGKVLYDAKADERRYPASLTKMMTLYVLFEDLERGRFKLNSAFRVSKNASQQAPSKLGLRAGDEIRVEDAIRALVTKSANDAAAVIGENVSGSVPAFADRMTRTARAIGMSSSRFRNASGLPDPGQYTTARDMMRLGVALQVRFPRYYEFFKTRSFAFRGRVYGNHNNLLGRVDGVDGIKTGYINASGFNLVSSVKRDGRKIVAVVMGGRTARSRDAHMVQLINTYLPQASRGRGYDDDLIAAVRSAPRVAASAPHPAPVVSAGIGSHPTPLARPGMAIAAAVDPAEAAVARPSRVLTMANATLPSSAAEAFADVAGLEQGSTDTGEDEGASQDLLGQMIERKTGIAPMAVASIDPATVASVPAAKAPAASKAAKPARAAEAPAAAPASSATGWHIQIGAVADKSAADALLAKARSKAGSALAKADPVTETFAKGGQTYVRARFAGFANEKEAQRACAALKKNDFGCFALRL